MAERDSISKHRDANMTTRVLVRDIMNSTVVSCHPDDSVNEIAKKMKDERIGSIVIMRNENPVGIVTDWDIVTNTVVQDVRPSMMKGSDIMKQLYTIEGEDSVTEAARQLKAKKHQEIGCGL